MALWVLGQLTSVEHARTTQYLMEYDPAPPYAARSDAGEVTAGRDGPERIGRSGPQAPLAVGVDDAGVRSERRHGPAPRRDQSADPSRGPRRGPPRPRALDRDGRAAPAPAVVAHDRRAGRDRAHRARGVGRDRQRQLDHRPAADPRGRRRGARGRLRDLRDREGGAPPPAVAAARRRAPAQQHDGEAPPDEHRALQRGQGAELGARPRRGARRDPRERARAARRGRWLRDAARGPARAARRRGARRGRRPRRAHPARRVHPRSGRADPRGAPRAAAGGDERGVRDACPASRSAARCACRS